MAYPLVKFVEEPAEVPVVLLDCNVGGAGNLRVPPDDFDLGTPEDGLREVTFSVMVDRSYTGSAAGMNAVSKVLNRPNGWLMFQRDAANKPVFARWFKDESRTGSVSWQYVQENTLQLPVTLVCEDGLYAEPVVLDTVEIVNNPGAASGNKASYVLPAIKGDLPTPLKVDIVPDDTLGPDWAGFQPFMASVAYLPGVAWDGPILWDLVSAQWTAGTETGANQADGGFIGGSYRQTTFTGVNDDLMPRLTGSPVAAPKPGRYKVMLRCALTNELSAMQVRIGQVFNLTETRYGPTTTIHREPNLAAGTVYICWVDLGQQTFPFGAHGLDYTDAGAATIPEIVLDGGRVSGAANLRWDALLLIPLETVATAQRSATQTSRFHGFGIEDVRSGVWDGFKQRFAAYNFGTTLANLRHPEIRGGWLDVVPGANNVLTLLQQSLTDEPFFTDLPRGDVITNLSHVTLSYMPKYTHLRPDTE